MVKKIKFHAVFGPLNSSKEAKNIHKALNYKKFIKQFETTKFQLVNKHNSKIKFSVYIEERDVTLDDDFYMPVADIVIKRIFN
ncbi:unnamed protein product [Meloidogyne enterolobii]|uniref:Uncharacterized protein n=1 Tax=Meloidogyne enterolobii TaxID=390850 RepID=A0ACB0ZMF7_MELEN